jgi:hypothetical protein
LTTEEEKIVTALQKEITAAEESLKKEITNIEKTLS